MEKTKIIIDYCNTFNNYEVFSKVLDDMFKERKNIIFYIPLRNGSDTMSVKYSKEKNIDSKEFSSEWLTYGDIADSIRNSEMIKDATSAILFWDGLDKGIERLANSCRKKELVTVVFNANTIDIMN